MWAKNHAIPGETFGSGAIAPVEYGLTEEGNSPLAAASQDHVLKLDADHPSYEVSWSASADIDSGIMTCGFERYRHCKGFTERTQAVAWFDACEGEYPTIIDRRTGERLTIRDHRE